MSRRWLLIFTPWSGSCILTTIRSIWAKEVEGLRWPPPPPPYPDAPEQPGMRRISVLEGD